MSLTGFFLGIRDSPLIPIDDIGEIIMKLSEPKVITFIVAVVLAVLALLGTFAKIPLFSAYGFWVLLIAFILLALGNLVKGL
jgi:hypothetical protein